MAAPTLFDRQTSFALYSAENPGEPHSGADLDTEFNAVKVTTDELIANLGLIQDDDGSLARGSVGREHLDGSLVIGFNEPSAWETATQYDGSADAVFHELKFYLCLVDHTSGNFASDLSAGYWRELADFNVENLLDDGSVTTAKLADTAVTTAKLGNGAVTAAKINDGSVGTNNIVDGTVTASKLSADAKATFWGTGDVKLTLKPLPDAGWVMFDDRTIARSATRHRARPTVRTPTARRCSSCSGTARPTSSRPCRAAAARAPTRTGPRTRRSSCSARLAARSASVAPAPG